MSEKLCKNCVHWVPFAPLPTEKPRWDERAADRALGFGGICGRTESIDGYVQTPGALAYAEDFESSRAQLLTSPEFGCVMFFSGDACAACGVDLNDFTVLVETSAGRFCSWKCSGGDERKDR